MISKDDNPSPPERERTASRRWMIGIVLSLVFGIFGAVMALLNYLDRDRTKRSRPRAPAVSPRESQPAAPAATPGASPPAEPPPAEPAAPSGDPDPASDDKGKGTLDKK